ncbi:cytochrome P450 [Pyronema omphalodes]|nr:cytochrome P450 [Pyronema omphalodes]
MHPALLIIALFLPLCLLYRSYQRKSSLPLLHPLSEFTTLPILVVTLLGRRNQAIHKAHLQHGPVVRLSPKEVSFASPEYLSTVYTGFPKAPWYNIMRNYGVAPMFAMLEGKDHAARKRLLAGDYSNTSVSRSSMLREVADEVLPVLLRSFDKSGTVEVWSRFVELTMDFITAYLFTRELGSRFLEGEDRDILNRYHSRRGYFAVSSELPAMASWIVPKWIDEANDKIEAWCYQLCKTRREERRDERRCIVDSLDSAGGLNDKEIASEALDHIGAGHETTALALSFTLAALSSRPDLQSELRRSLGPLMQQQSNGWMLPKLEGDGYKALEEHPLLNSIIKESLRLYSPIPGSQPRIIPRDMKIHEHNIPAGTTISSQAWTLHRDPAIWGEDVEDFRPERWLEGRGVEKAWWAFGSGGRGCIGQHLARWELRVVIASIYSNFETKSKGAAGVDAYTTAPAYDVEVEFRRILTSDS